MKSISLIPGLARGLKVIEFVASRRSPVSFTEIGGTLPGVNRSTLSRLLKNLVALGYVEKSAESGLYGPGDRLGLFANAGSKRLTDQLLSRFKPIMALISEEEDVTALLFERLGRHLSCVHKETTETSMTMQSVGNAMDLAAEHACSPWAVMAVAFAPDAFTDCADRFDRRMLRLARKNGYSYDDQYRKAVLLRWCFPIFDHQGSLVGGLGFGGYKPQFDEKRLAAFPERVRSLMVEAAPILT